MRKSIFLASVNPKQIDQSLAQTYFDGLQRPFTTSLALQHLGKTDWNKTSNETASSPFLREPVLARRAPSRIWLQVQQSSLSRARQEKFHRLLLDVLPQPILSETRIRKLLAYSQPRPQADISQTPVIRLRPHQNIKHWSRWPLKWNEFRKKDNELF